MTLLGRLARDVVSGNTFLDCAALTSISIGGVTEIGASAFESSGLAKISGMGAVHTIEENAFSGAS